MGETWPCLSVGNLENFGASMYAYMYICMYVGMYVCVYVCMYVCMYAFLYVRICLGGYTSGKVGKVPSAVTAAVGKGHKDVVPRPLANGQSTAVPGRAQWSPAHTPLRCRDEHSLLWGPESVVA